MNFNSNMQIRPSSIPGGFPAQIKRIEKKFCGCGEKFSQSRLKAGSEDLTGKGKEIVRGKIPFFTRCDENYSTNSTMSPWLSGSGFIEARSRQPGGHG